MSNEDITEKVFRFVCGWFGVTKEEILSRSRRRVLVDARTVWCYVMRCRTDLSLHELGRMIERTHASVAYFVAKGCDCEKERKLNPYCHDAIERVESTFSL